MLLVRGVWCCRVFPSVVGSLVIVGLSAQAAVQSVSLLVHVGLAV